MKAEPERHLRFVMADGARGGLDVNADIVSDMLSGVPVRKRRENLPEKVLKS